MNMKDIIEWRDTSRLSVKLDENDLIRIDGLINEVIRLERLNQKGKCFSCRFWKSSQESYSGYCSIGRRHITIQTISVHTVHGDLFEDSPGCRGVTNFYFRQTTVNRDRCMGKV